MRFIACRVISNTYDLFPEEFRRDYVVILSGINRCRFCRNSIQWHEMKTVMCNSIPLWLYSPLLPHFLFVIKTAEHSFSSQTRCCPGYSPSHDLREGVTVIGGK